MPSLLHSLAPGKFGATVVPFKSVGLTPSVALNPEQNSGDLFPKLIKIPGADPRIQVTMPFGPAYAALGLGVTELTALEIYLAKFSSYARAAGSVHTKWALATNARAAAMITGWSVDQDGDLNAVVDIALLGDATAMAHPLVQTDNNALPTLASQPTLYTLGPMSINGTVRPGLMSAGVDLGQSLDIRRTDGSRYPTSAGLLGGAPKMVGEHGDPVTLLGVLGLIGLHITSNLIQYFRRYDATSGVVSDTAGSALSVTMAAGYMIPTSIDAGQLSVARTGIEAHGTSVSGTHPLAISTGATVPELA